MTDSIDNSAIAKDAGKGVRKKAKDLTVEDFYFLKIGKMWRYMKTQHFSFWMICCYIFFEYSRPQAIFPAIDILPWAQTFILLSLIGAVFDPSVHWVSHPMNLLMDAFAILIFLASIYAYVPDISKEHYIDFYGWFVIYYLIITIVNTRQRFYIFMLIIILSSAKIAIGTSWSWITRGFSFASWGLMGPKGYFQNSGELAILMLTLFPVAYYLYDYLHSKVNKFEKTLLIIFWVAPILTILGASSRGAQLALVVQLLAMFYKKIFRFKQLVLILIMIYAAYGLLPEEQKARFEEAGEDKTSIQRKLYWEHGYEMIKEHPLFGIGFFNFPYFYQDHFSSDLLYPKAQLPHNIFIQVGTDAGAISLFIFASILLGGIYLSWRMSLSNIDNECNIFMKASAISLLGYAIAGQFVSVAYYPFLWIGVSVIVACHVQIKKSNTMDN